MLHQSECLQLGSSRRNGYKRPKALLAEITLLLLAQPHHEVLDLTRKTKQVHDLRHPCPAQAVPPRNLCPVVNQACVQKLLKLVGKEQRMPVLLPLIPVRVRC